MKLNERILWAAGILLLDFIFFLIPVVALFAVYVLIARPPQFKAWLDKVYL